MNLQQQTLGDNVIRALKRRQRSATTRDDIIKQYKQDLEATWVSASTTIIVWFQPEGLVLNCKRVDADNLPCGFTRVGQDRFQYNFTDPEVQHSKRFRPIAYRMPFLANSGFYDKSMTVSHLCHNNWCYNWNHHTLELLEINKARNGCAAGPSCRHKTKCLRPGLFSDC